MIRLITLHRKFLLLLAAFGLLTVSLNAQDRCSIIRYEQQVRPSRENQGNFEQWMSRRLRESGSNLLGTLSTYTIPVVVHVIHNGESVGSGANISDAQIQSQLTVLNRDFNRTNTDASQTPADFTGVAGQLSVEFVLARRDPSGLPSNGIVRVNGGKSAWSLNEDTAFKSLSYWPAEDYLNIWVLNLSGGDIGYASFPVSPLPGLEGTPNDRLTDGIIVDHFTFGSTEFGSFSLDSRYNKGRTATHEIGHFLGLRHIWGDGSSCQATDYVSDTPSQPSETTGCPSHPQSPCSVPKMFQNYMDYTNDACMNIFTSGQVSRMVVVLTNSPRRASLTSSLGSVTPNYTTEASVSVVEPSGSACPGQLIPAVSVQCIGSQPLSSVRISLAVTGQSAQTQTFAVNLSQGQSTTLYFPAINVSAGSPVNVTATLLEANGSADELASNNQSTSVTTIPEVTTLPLLEEFPATLPTSWTLANPDGSTTWEWSTVRGGSMLIEGYTYNNAGEKDALITPLFNATDNSELLLQFDVAYARYPGNEDEELIVYVVEDCSVGFSAGTEIYRKKGNELATAVNANGSFIPEEKDWRRETVILNTFANRNNLRLSFVFHNNYGNNLFLDRVRIATGEITNLEIVNLVEPSPATCIEKVLPKVKLRNLGTVTAQSVQMTVTLNNGPATSVIYQVQLPPGEETDLRLSEFTLDAGTNQLDITGVVVGATDEDADNNSLQGLVSYITKNDRVPARYDFDDEVPWSAVPTGASIEWEERQTNQGTSLVFPAYENNEQFAQGWLVSPSLDLATLNSAGMFADFSYSIIMGEPEKIKLLASLDCGITFSEVLLNLPANEISTNSSPGEWLPSTNGEWSRPFIDLGAVAGEPSVLLAFVATNSGSNNLYIDNIELFTDNNPEQKEVTGLFEVYTNEVTREEQLTFKLEEPSTVRLQILTSTGLPVLDNTYTDILNQTLTFQLGRPTGIYIYRLFINGQPYAVRHFVP